MEELHRTYIALKRRYDRGENPLKEIGELGAHCLSLLGKGAKSRLQATVSHKSYSVFVAGAKTSRPYRPDIFTEDVRQFELSWRNLLVQMRPATNSIDLDPTAIVTALYTCITAPCVCYDLWKTSSRKTPGTIFEIELGSIIGSLLQSFARTKFISLPELRETVSTDIVFDDQSRKKGLVFPVKITTRERIVQPFAHQRILESVFGPERYRSVLLCVSEVQRDKTKAVNEICVPGTIKLFQAHLAKRTAIYYLDPPVRYLREDLVPFLKIGSIGDLLTADLRRLVAATS